MKADELFQKIATDLAAKLEQGVRPWAKPWDAQPSPMDLPHNVTTGKAYRGANVFWLWMAQASGGYETAQWLTYKQAAAMGGNVRKGEKGTPAFYWAVKKGENAKGEETTRMLPVSFTVFNVAQCENLPAAEPVAPVAVADRNAAAEALLNASGARIQHGGNRAYFVPSQDFIQLPAFEAFRGADDYYSTAFHELGHWTGHESRLAREFGKRFGDDAYAFEELVAELTAAFVCGSQGFAAIARDDHAAYLASWIRVLKDDAKAFVSAASAAQKAADLILSAGAEQAAGEASEGQGEPLALALAA